MKNQFIYDSNLYNQQSAAEILPWLFKKLPVASLIDIGCGTGTWLSVAKQLGVQKLKGFDGSDYDAASFEVPAETYEQVDLTKNIEINEKYDLCICLEVGEHLPAFAADTLVNLLCQLAPVVLFSAAVPGQPGQDHINSQWPSYWQMFFSRQGYHAYDIMRPAFWNNEKIEWWYRQNMILYARPGFLKDETAKGTMVSSIVHPTLYEIKLAEIASLQEVKLQTVFYPSFSFALRTLAKSILVSPRKRKKA